MSVVGLGCMHACGAASAHERGSEILPLPCAGRLDLATTLWPFAVGHDGLVLLSCEPRECRHRRCDEGVEECTASGATQVSEAREVIGHAGLSPKRAAHRIVSKSDDLTGLVWAYRDDVERLGGWVRNSLPSPSEILEDFVGDRCARLFARIQALRGWGEGEQSPGAKYGGDGGDLLWLGCHDLRALAVGEKTEEGAALELWRRAGNSTGAIARWRCCGQPLLEVGEADAFAALAETNASLVAATGAKRLVTSCSHCAESFTSSYADVGVELDVEVVDLWQWARETLELQESTEPMAIVSSRQASERQLSVAKEMASEFSSIHEVNLPQGGGGSKPLRGAALTSSVMDMVDESIRLGAEALVVTSPHDARQWRMVMSPGGWQTGHSLPVMEVSEALLSLLRPRGRGHERMKG